MKSFFKSATALAVGMPMMLGVAHAADGFYGKVEANYTYRGTLNVSGPAQGGFANFLGSGARETQNQFSGGGAAVGYSWAPGWRLELEVSRHKADLEKDFDISSGSGQGTLLMVNGYMDFNKEGMVQPYAGAGVGYGMFEIKGATAPLPANQTLDGKKNNFAYQAQAGIGIRMSENTILNLGYRHIGTDQLKIRMRSVVPASAAAYKTEVDYHEDSLTAGLRFHF